MFGVKQRVKDEKMDPDPLAETVEKFKNVAMDLFVQLYAETHERMKQESAEKMDALFALLKRQLEEQMESRFAQMNRESAPPPQDQGGRKQTPSDCVRDLLADNPALNDRELYKLVTQRGYRDVPIQTISSTRSTFLQAMRALERKAARNKTNGHTPPPGAAVE